MTQKRLFAKDLGIALESRQETEYFKWFLACLLFGKPVQQEVARRAFLELVDNDITSPEAIRDAGWDKLVNILDEGHYARYDFSTATKLLDVSSTLIEGYGSFGRFLEQHPSTDELATQLRNFKGIGPKTVDIFLRDMGPVLEGE
ncbi:hypothetical protein PHISP_06748 [Aspergillus sp. HF37]|nr:hypothetical protein PHISP_06748 [Aspergillus sp. HF37]